MSVSIGIANPPENTFWWLGSLNEPFAGSGPLRPDEAWVFPDESWGGTELIHPIHGPGIGELYSIRAFTEEQVLLDSAILTGTLVEDGKNYVFDFSTQTFSEVEGGSMLGIIAREIQRLDTGTRENFPTSLPVGTGIQVSISVRNLSEPQVVGVRWVIASQTSITQEYEMWTPWMINTNGVHVFDGPPLTLDESGDWGVYVEVLANPGAPVTVDSYDGLLVQVIVAEEFKAEIVDKRVIAPPEEAAFGSEFIPGSSVQAEITVQNQMGTSQQIGYTWTIIDPDSLVVWQYDLPVNQWVDTPAGQYAAITSIPIVMEKKGTWNVAFEALMNPGEPVAVATYQGPLVIITETPAPPGGGTPWIPIAIGVGLLAVGLTVVTKKKRA